MEFCPGCTRPREILEYMEGGRLTQVSDSVYAIMGK